MSRILPGLSRAEAALPLAAQAFAQLLAARENVLAVGHHRLNVTDAAAHRLFWGEVLGGKLSRFGETDAVKLPNALLLLRVQDPTGGSSGSTVEHLGFSVPDLRGIVPRLQAAGIPMVTAQVVAGCEGDIHYSADQNLHLAFAEAPDGMRVELMEDKALGGTVAHHIHIYTEDDASAQAWYAEHFEGKPGMRGRFRKVDVPGIELSFALSGGPVQPTKGRVLDYIGFAVDRLEEFCAGLERKGVCFDMPFANVEGTKVFEAALTDPWGTFISLTEGLDPA